MISIDLFTVREQWAAFFKVCLVSDVCSYRQKYYATLLKFTGKKVLFWTFAITGKKAALLKFTGKKVMFRKFAVTGKKATFSTFAITGKKATFCTFAITGKKPHS